MDKNNSMQELVSQNILVGVTGGIGAYKACELVRLLKKAGANVRVVLTTGASHFVKDLTFQALTGERVYTELLDAQAEAGMGHIELAKWADILLVVPASANMIAKFAHGLADELLSTLYLATQAQVFVAPAMNQAMWHHPRTQSNLSILAQDGVVQLGPATGEQACGDVGVGRLLEPVDIFKALNSQRIPKRLQGQRILVTAGPTHEPIDAVRFIANRSSGKMGYALAKVAVRMGAEVTLVTGPTNLNPPVGLSEVVPVRTCQQMYDAVMDRIKNTDCYIGSAAVGDFKVATQYTSKIKKEKNHMPPSIELVENPDILHSVGHHQDRPKLVIGFAAETDNLDQFAKEKCQRKNADMIIGNDVGQPGIAFDSDENEVKIYKPRRDPKQINRSQKSLIAEAILIEISDALGR